MAKRIEDFPEPLGPQIMFKPLLKGTRAYLYDMKFSTINSRISKD